MITDNAIVAFELLHSLSRRNNGKKDFLALKFDMSKAYDRIMWVFLERVIEKMGFGSRWVRRVLNCITTSSFQVLMNGKLEGNIVPARGLRQGCSLFFYFFICYANILSCV